MRRLLLVLGALWRVSSWIPFVGISIHVRVEMDIASGIRDESAGGDDFVAVACGYAFTTDVPPEGCTEKVQSQRIAETHVYDRKFCLPRFYRYVVKLIAQGCFGILSVLRCSTTDLVLRFGEPLGRGCKIADYLAEFSFLWLLQYAHLDPLTQPALIPLLISPANSAPTMNSTILTARSP